VQVSINDLTYVPTIFIRNAEMQALEHLSNAEKDRIVPLVLLKPWANSAQLTGSIKRIQKAYPDRHFLLDVDRYYTKGSDRPAWAQFLSMQSSAGNFAAWREFVGDVDLAIPCIQAVGASAPELSAQIAWAESLQRPFALRIENRFPCNTEALLQAFQEIDHSNYLVILDAGWSRDVLSLQLWASSWIGALISRHADVKIVVSGSSFPNEFMNYGQYGEEPLQERPFFNGLRMQHNAARLIYGDWASSRPHGPDGGGPGYPRIDLPLSNRWVFFRANAIDGNFRPLAEQATDSPLWDFNLNIWGKYFINNTATGSGYTINSAQQAAAARINIHMSEQIAFGAGTPIGDVPEDFVD
jgi:hypothetical protein